MPQRLAPAVRPHAMVGLLVSVTAVTRCADAPPIGGPTAGAARGAEDEPMFGVTATVCTVATGPGRARGQHGDGGYPSPLLPAGESTVREQAIDATAADGGIVQAATTITF